VESPHGPPKCLKEEGGEKDTGPIPTFVGSWWKAGGSNNRQDLHKKKKQISDMVEKGRIY